MVAVLEHWIGKTENASEWAAADRIHKLNALLDGQTAHWAEGMVPPLAHWLYCQPAALQSQMDTDGHPKRGGFIPPIELPRRMWVGSDVVFGEPIALGQPLHRKSEVRNIIPKKNKRGEELVFLTLHHQIRGERQGSLEETQHIVYKSDQATPPDEGRVAPHPPVHSRPIHFDVVSLFRFSALTFNAHRIHFDRDYAKHEGYPGLVVHGPYLAFLLLNHFIAATGTTPSSFSFTAERPLFDNSPPARLCCADKNLWVESSRHRIVMSAQVKLK